MTMKSVLKHCCFEISSEIELQMKFKAEVLGKEGNHWFRLSVSLYFNFLASRMEGH